MAGSASGAGISPSRGRSQSIRNAILTADKGDLVAVIGKGHERYNIDKNGYHDFDEREIIKEALREREVR